MLLSVDRESPENAVHLQGYKTIDDFRGRLKPFNQANVTKPPPKQEASKVRHFVPSPRLRKQT